MTDQELFDAVVSHARKQKCKSLLPSGGCAYRGVDGTKCFIGALIPDERYYPELEGMPCHYHVGGAAGLETRQLYLARDLQIIHDDRPIFHWEAEFRRIAREYGLVYTPPEPGCYESWPKVSGRLG